MFSPSLSLLSAVITTGLFHATLVYAADAQNGTDSRGSYIITTGNSSIISTTDESSDNKEAVIVAITLTCVALLFVVFAVFFIYRRRQLLMVDKEKKNQMLMTSARNAGVYQDPTVTVLPDENTPASPEHERLNAIEEI